MKTKLLLVLLLMLASSKFVASQEVVATAGGFFESDNLSLSWTLGETVVETFETDNFILTQGFQQPYSFYLSQILNIPAGWSGVSSYIDPLNKGVDDIFSPHIPDFIILASITEFYYPDGGANTILNWSSETGYQIKTENEFNVTLTGSKIAPAQVDLATGWNLMPVLTPCGATTDEVFNGMGNLTIVKEVAGSKIYWPDYGIETLASLDPGKAYWVLMDDPTLVTYPECAKNSSIAQSNVKPKNVTPWNDLTCTASSHAIAFPAEVLVEGGLQAGDFIGAFTPEGLCAGRVEILNLKNNTALTAFANDETSLDRDGFEFGEMLQFRVYRPQGDKEFNMTVNYNEALPQQGIFNVQGLSAVKSITLDAKGTSEFPEMISRVYPNPSHGQFTLSMNFWPEKMQIQLMDTRGNVIRVYEPGMLAGGSAYRLDLNDLQKGVYFLKLADVGFIEVKKIVIN